jgi:hypothetical protein
MLLVITNGVTQSHQATKTGCGKNKEVFKRQTFSEEAMKAMKTPEQIAKTALWIAQQDTSTLTSAQ